MSQTAMTSWEERMQRIHREMEQEHPPAWIPGEEGAEIAGIMVDFNPAAYTKFGRTPVATLQGPNGGRRSVWLMHTVLRNEFFKHRPEMGELVVIRYLGRKTPEGGGDSYAAYKVHVDRDGATGRTPDWDRLAETYGVESAPEPVASAPAELRPEDLPTSQADDIPF